MKLPERAPETVKEFTNDDEFTFLVSIKHNHPKGLFKLIRELILLFTKDGNYDARAHQLIISIAEMLGVPRDLVELHCESIYDLMYQQGKSTPVEDGTSNNEDEVKTKSKVKKYVMVGLASLGGAAVMGVTGGLAAPVVVSALAGVVGGSLALSATAAGVVGSLFGVAGAGLTASKMNKRLGDLEEFSFHSLNPIYDQTSLMITIAITGWISGEGNEDFARPWQNLQHMKEQYYLRYESKYLLELSQAMDYLLSFVFSYAAQEALKFTFLSSVMAAIALPAAMMTVANVIDNPWDVCLNRAAKAGKRLADILRSRRQGKRPTSLIGFGLGARVIFFCLQELAQHDDTLGIISEVVMLGAPVTASEEQWKSITRIVSGTILNGYSTSDWLLKYLYRTSNAAIKIAGLQEIPLRDRHLKNINLTHLVGGHLDYHKKIDQILNYINIRTRKTDDVDFDANSNMIQPSSLTLGGVVLDKEYSDNISNKKQLCNNLLQNLGSLKLNKMTSSETSRFKLRRARSATDIQVYDRCKIDLRSSYGDLRRLKDGQSGIVGSGEMLRDRSSSK